LRKPGELNPGFLVYFPLAESTNIINLLLYNMVKIAPSILAADFSCLGKEIKKAQKLADMIHLDIMDGHFVPNLTFGKDISRVSKAATKLPHDAHLMVTHPEHYIADFASIGVEYISFHLELEGSKIELGQNRWVYVANGKVNKTRTRKLLNDIKIAGSKAGLALSPQTEFELAVPFLKDVDLLILMSVNPGFAGQKFMPEVYDKIKRAAAFKQDNGLRYEIMVDGGVGTKNARKLADCGATILVSGSSFFSDESFQKTIRELRS